MNREIKFRAFHLESKTMYWFDIMNGNRHGTGSGYISMALWGEPITKHLHKDNVIPVDPNDCKIMQYTGLKDKNGKEIYEGDIVELFGYRKPVDYHEGAFGYWNEIEFISYNKNNHNICFEEGNCMIEAKIIGNIYENPELLNTK